MEYFSSVWQLDAGGNLHQMLSSYEEVAEKWRNEQINENWTK